MIQAIIFDLDDTLIDRSESIDLFLREQYEKFQDIKRKMPFAQFQQRFVELDEYGYAPKKTLYEKLVDEFNLHISPQQLLSDFNENNWKYCILFAGVKEQLTLLRNRKYRLGIVTNGSLHSQMLKIRFTGLDLLIDMYLVSEQERVRKPNPTIFYRVAQRLKVDPSECIFVGDNPESDIFGAQRVGMKTVWIPRHLVWPSDLGIQADYIISNFQELFNLILCLNYRDGLP